MRSVRTFPDSVTQLILDEREQFFMDRRVSESARLLNLRGGGSTGKLSDETKERIRIANTGFSPSPETRMKLSKWQIGRKRPHISESNRRRAEAGTLWFQNRIAPKGKDHPRFGVKHTPESLARMSASHKGAIVTVAHRQKVSLKVRGEGNAAAILTESQVREIRSKYQPYVYQQSTLAREYCVSRATISGIVDGRLWKHI